jgi:uncharacterized protein
MPETQMLETTMKPATVAVNPRKLFVNIPVRDLTKAMNFFGALGFQYNPQFADETAACMLVGEDAYFMLLTEKKFRDFSRRPVADARTTTGAMFALSCTTRDEVDEMMRKAIAAGGSPAAEPQDHGFMYGLSFYDLDGHHWEVFWMDPAAVG